MGSYIVQRSLFVRRPLIFLIRSVSINPRFVGVVWRMDVSAVPIHFLRFAPETRVANEQVVAVVLRG
jgi:hypothetical protein